MNTSKSDPDFTNHTFAKTGWTENVNIPFDKVINERKQIESSQGFSRFYTSNSGVENPLNEFVKVQKQLETEYSKN